MRLRLGGIPLIVIATWLAPCSIALAQNSVGEPAAANSTQVTQPAQGGVNWKGVGVGAGTVAGNVLYMPAKVVYGLLGGVAGGAGYALTGGNKQVADTIWRSSLGGDYILTPDMITGKDPVHFSGPTQTAPPTDSGSAAVPNPPSTMASTKPSAPIGGNSAGATSSLSSSAVPPTDAGALYATHPIDSGAGPVSGSVAGSSNPAYGAPSTSATKASGAKSVDSGNASGDKSSAASKGSPLPSTSIE
jgi:hypothetical protein